MSIFNTDNTPSDNSGDSQSPTPQSSDSLLDQLKDIKNEKGEPKYTTLEAAVNALKHSQEFIPSLKEENSKLQAEVSAFKEQQDKIANLESVVERLTASNEPSATPAATGMDEQTVAKLLEETLNQREKAQQANSNLASVTSELESRYGTEAEDKFYKKAEELGMSKEAFEALAKSSPKAVMEFFPKTTPAPSINTGHNSAGFVTSNQVKDGPLEAPKSSVLFGASSEELRAELARHKEAVYAKYNVQE